MKLLTICLSNGRHLCEDKVTKINNLVTCKNDFGLLKNGGIDMADNAPKSALPSKKALLEFLKTHKYKSFPPAIDAARRGKKLVFIFLDQEAYGDRSYYYCEEDDTVYSEYLSIGD